jgi:hypothetical protein
MKTDETEAHWSIMLRFSLWPFPEFEVRALTVSDLQIACSVG